MGFSSAAEARLNARVRPEIAVMRSRTPYPKRRLVVVASEDVESSAPGSPSAVPGETALPVKETRPGTTKQAAKARRVAPAGPIRLTRRGRIVVWALVVFGVVAAAMVLWLVLASQAQATGGAGSRHVATATLRRVVVRPGQTLWSIALAADPTADPRVIVQQIIDDNELAGTSIQAGQVLWVPRG